MKKNHERKQSWSLDQHEKFYGVNFNAGLANWIVKNFNINRLLEFGCGPGYYCKFWSDAGIEVVHGIEPEKMSASCFKNAGCQQFEYDITSDPIPNGLLVEYDLIISVEVLEHIDLGFHDDIFNFLTSRQPKHIVFSAARPGQKGVGHVACREKEEWAQEFIRRGYELDVQLTNDICQASDKKNINHQRNLQVFNKVIKND